MILIIICQRQLNLPVVFAVFNLVNTHSVTLQIRPPQQQGRKKLCHLFDIDGLNLHRCRLCFASGPVHVGSND